MRSQPNFWSKSIITALAEHERVDHDNDVSPATRAVAVGRPS